MDVVGMTAVASGSIELGEVSFDIFTTDFNSNLILFCRRGFAITGRHRHIIKHSNRRFFVNTTDFDRYLDYAFQRLDRIIQSEEISVSDKADIVYHVGKRTVMRLLENPRSGEQVHASSRIVESCTDLILSEARAAESLFAISSTDSYTFSHSINVCTFSILVGEALFDWDRSTLYELGMAGLLHDLGKVLVDRRILLKPARLSRGELLAVQKHPIYSFDLITFHALSEGIAAAGRSHHERMDGSGYPDSLCGDKIHPFARIVAVADVYDAMTSARVYSDEKPCVAALREMAAMRNQLDSSIFQTLVSLVLRSPSLAGSLGGRLTQSVSD